jgi:hypothetical protein
MKNAHDSTAGMWDLTYYIHGRQFLESGPFMKMYVKMLQLGRDPVYRKLQMVKGKK